MNAIERAGLLWLLLLVGGVEAEPRRARPPELFVDRGACPFECCTYRKWTAKSTVVLQAQPSRSAPTVGVIGRGDEVRALTGLVYTRRGLFKATREEQGFVAGATVSVYTPLGEDYYRAWRNGDMVEIQIAVSPEEPRIDDWGRWQRLPHVEWWSRIRARTGVEGWTREGLRFKGIDACS